MEVIGTRVHRESILWRVFKLQSTRQNLEIVLFSSLDAIRSVFIFVLREQNKNRSCWKQKHQAVSRLIGRIKNFLQNEQTGNGKTMASIPSKRLTPFIVSRIKKNSSFASAGELSRIYEHSSKNKTHFQHLSTIKDAATFFSKRNSTLPTNCLKRTKQFPIHASGASFDPPTFGSKQTTSSSADSIWNTESVLPSVSGMAKISSIENCAFSGATYGVQASRGLKPAHNLTLNHCLYHNYPQYEWSVRWLSWKEIYAHYSASSLIAAKHDQTVVQNCVAVHCGDGLKLTSSDEPTTRILASKNWISNCTDDAIEFDGPAENVTVQENIIANSFVSLGLSPASKGPVLIEDNLFLHSFPQQQGALFKLLAAGKIRIIQNILVQKNFFWGNWLCWWNESPVKNLHLKENLLFTIKQSKKPWPPGVTKENNQFHKIAIKPKDAPQSEITSLKKSLHSNEHFLQLLKKRLQEKPGPRWWQYNKHPATFRMHTLRSELNTTP